MKNSSRNRWSSKTRQLLHRRRAEGDQVATVPPPADPNQRLPPGKSRSGRCTCSSSTGKQKQNMSPVIMVRGSSHTGACWSRRRTGAGLEPISCVTVSPPTVDQATRTLGVRRVGHPRSSCHDQGR
jgi:hypothetical protein